MYNTFRYLKLSYKYILLLLFFQNFVFSHDYSTQSSKENDFFVEAYELLDRGEYEKSFSILKDCVHYDLRCLTLIGNFYYLGLKPVERDVCNALYIWKVCSDYGSSDAQFYLGVMYSNYFSLPNLYSYYAEEQKIEDNIILFRIYLFLKVKHLEKGIADCIWGRKEKYKDEDKDKKFRSVPVIRFTENNELVLKIKNIRYNIDELELYFNNLNNFPDKYDKEKDGNINYNYTRNHNLSLLYFYSSNLANHPGSILALGIKHMNGYGVEKDCEAASRYYLKLTNDIFNSDEKTEFEIIDLIRLNIPYYDKYSMNNKKIKSIELLLESSLHNNHKVLTMIARRYLIGIDGVKKDYKKAHNYLIKAAKYKNSEAISLLGYIYLLGLGVKIDYDKAIEYFIEGNKLNDSLSYNGLGYMHFFGLGNFKKNTNLAFYYFELAAKGNLSSAQFNLACMYLSGVGTSQSFQSAFYWFYKSLNNGNLLAAYVIGFMHYNGIITSRNCKLALSLLSKVAENNPFIISTTNKIIRYTEKGRNKEALFLMALLAETGCLQSQINLSYKIINSEFSLFLPSDPNSKKIYASRYLAMASERNDFKSLYILGDYAYKGYGIYVHLLPKNNLPINPLYDLNDNKYLYKKNKRKKVTDNNKKNNSTLNNKNILTNSNEIISTDFIDEQGIVFNNKWRFNYSFKFFFNKIDYELAYHHYKSIISFYPNNIYVIQIISKACYNLGYMHYYGIGVPKNIEKSLAYFNSSIKVYPSYKVPSVLFVLYIKFNKYIHNLKKKIRNFFNFL
ncbi:ubiquitin-protein ligase, putative [Plasmodium relictum]|uniref:Ubiquitin-protein ligase, putative n=1 Tax=Plasmodium relictum TaxID=85471 RepID=A0A1J1HCX5_PLARL|nr:ubiquitin-protein ligase, putative [Plasmodium relictum]CRH01442.1 ubiquitin-protein ligase, putative [Plasmodium relictum]